MKIIKLSAKNVLRLDAVEITPEGNLVVIGGMNEQGKTSVLDSIFLALGGRLAKHKKPLKDGASKGKSVVDLGDLIVTRTFTKNGGGNLKVTNKEGAVYPSPQTMLDNLVGKLTFDPLAWVRMDDTKQLITLKEMVGLNFSKLDEKRKQIYDKRTTVNSEGKRLRGAFDSMTEYPDAPEEEILVSELMLELERRRATNNENDNARNEIRRLNGEIDKANREVVYLETEIEKLTAKLQSEKHNLSRLTYAKLRQRKLVDEIKDADEQEIKDKITGAEKINAEVRANRDRKIKEAELEKTRENSKALTEQIEDIDQQKADELAKAEFPIPDMAFDETGVLYKGIPFSQCSSAEQLRVSVAMGIAMNPKLKVLLLRDGSLLDDGNLEMVAEMAEKADCQIWLERVGKGKECQVIIEDGRMLK